MQPGVSIIPVVFWSKSGLAAARPAATGLRNGSIWYSTDTKDLDQVQGGSWVTIFDYSALTAALNIHAAISDAHHSGAAVLEGTLARFQANAGSGDMTNPPNINDNNTGTEAYGNTINQYVTVDFGEVVRLKRWRHYGKTSHNGSGRWKIQYYSLVTYAWVDWVTDIPQRTTADWTSMTTETEISTDKIKVVITTVDTGTNWSYFAEVEVIY